MLCIFIVPVGSSIVQIPGLDANTLCMDTKELNNCISVKLYMDVVWCDMQWGREDDALMLEDLWLISDDYLCIRERQTSSVVLLSHK